jgi:hypothetical protein
MSTLVSAGVLRDLAETLGEYFRRRRLDFIASQDGENLIFSLCDPSLPDAIVFELGAGRLRALGTLSDFEQQIALSGIYERFAQSLSRPVPPQRVLTLRLEGLAF